MDAIVTGDPDDDVAALLSSLPLHEIDSLADVPLPSPCGSLSALDETASLDGLDDLDDLLPLSELLALQLEPLDTEALVADAPNPAATSSGGLKQKTRRKRASRSAAYDSNRARNQRRHELIYLRRRVDEMETALARVRSATIQGESTVVAAGAAAVVVAEGASQSTRMTTTTTRSSGSTGGDVWQQIATRQLDERRRAESENERLRLALETQLKVARSLEAILNRRSTSKSLEDCGLGSYARVYGSAADASDDRVFDALLTNVHEIYQNAERLVAQGSSSSSSSSSTGIRDARLRETGSGLLVEVFATDLLPFTLRETSVAAWQYFSHNKNHLPVPSRLYYERLDSTSSEDTVMERSGMERVANGTKAVIKLQQVLRRYVEHDRVVVTWSAIAQPVEFDDKPFTGFHLREWGCMVLREGVHDHDDDHDGGPRTVLQSCFFITPEFQNTSTDLNGDVGRLTEFVLGTTAASIAQWRQRIENILLDNHRMAS